MGRFYWLDGRIFEMFPDGTEKQERLPVHRLGLMQEEIDKQAGAIAWVIVIATVILI